MVLKAWTVRKKPLSRLNATESLYCSEIGLTVMLDGSSPFDVEQQRASLSTKLYLNESA
jgi:hypothetical protein